MPKNHTAPGDTQSAISSEYARLRTVVDEDVQRITESYLKDLGDTTGPLASTALDATEGGKRFRALCAQIGAAVADAVSNPNGTPEGSPELLRRGAELPGISELAVALEQYQAAALVHDDVIDKSDSRRGKPAGHVRISNSHRARNLLGDARIYGQDGAILAGDLLLAAAENSLALALQSATGETATKVLRHYSFMTGEVALGQFRDMTGSYIDPSAQHEIADGQDALRSALSVVRVKAARYSVVHPTLLGALSAGADSRLVETLRAILEPAGVAFQLRDDELGAFGKTSATGKPVGIDISEGKRTVLLALAWRNATEQEREVLASVYDDKTSSLEDIERAAAILERRGHEEHEAMILTLTEEALENLEAAQLPDAGKDLLRFLVNLLTDRDS